MPDETEKQTIAAADVGNVFEILGGEELTGQETRDELAGLAEAGSQAAAEAMAAMDAALDGESEALSAEGAANAPSSVAKQDRTHAVSAAVVDGESIGVECETHRCDGVPAIRGSYTICPKCGVTRPRI